MTVLTSQILEEQSAALELNLGTYKNYWDRFCIAPDLLNALIQYPRTLLDNPNASLTAAAEIFKAYFANESLINYCHPVLSNLGAAISQLKVFFPHIENAQNPLDLESQIICVNLLSFGEYLVPLLKFLHQTNNLKERANQYAYLILKHENPCEIMRVLCCLLQQTNFLQQKDDWDHFEVILSGFYEIQKNSARMIDEMSQESPSPIYKSSVAQNQSPLGIEAELKQVRFLTKKAAKREVNGRNENYSIPDSSQSEAISPVSSVRLYRLPVRAIENSLDDAAVVLTTTASLDALSLCSHSTFNF